MSLSLNPRNIKSRCKMITFQHLILFHKYIQCNYCIAAIYGLPSYSTWATVAILSEKPQPHHTQPCPKYMDFSLLREL